MLNKFNFPFYIICHFCLICIIVFYQFFLTSFFYVCGTFIKIGKDDSCTILMEFYVQYLWSYMYNVNGVVCTLSILVFKSSKNISSFEQGKIITSTRLRGEIGVRNNAG